MNRWLLDASLLDIAGGDPIVLVVETGCQYASPLAFPRALEVGLAVARLGSSSVIYQVGIFAAGASDAAAQGYFTLVYVGRESRRPVPLPPSWSASLETLG